MNTELLLKVRDRILAEPANFDMGTWVDSHSCGTTACIAGHAFLLSTGTHIERLNERFTTDSEIPIRFPWQAASMLDLAYQEPAASQSEAERLFYAHHWPLQFRMPYADATSSQKRAEIAAGRIDHFILTEGKE